MTLVAVNTYTHSVTYVADNILKSLKDIIVGSGLDPLNFVNDWDLNKRAIQAWLTSQHLKQVVLEVYDPTTNKPLGRWDIDIDYTSASGDGEFWLDTAQIRYHILKQGVLPSQAKYDLILRTHPGRADVAGWGAGSLRPTDGFVRQSLGSTISHSGLGAGAAYWRRA